MTEPWTDEDSDDLDRQVRDLRKQVRREHSKRRPNAITEAESRRACANAEASLARRGGALPPGPITPNPTKKKPKPKENHGKTS